MVTNLVVGEWYVVRGYGYPMQLEWKGCNDARLVKGEFRVVTHQSNIIRKADCEE